MSATPRTDKAEHYGSTSDNCCLVHEDDMKELELENIKLLEVARAAKEVNLVRLVDPCNPERTVGMLPIANRTTIEVWNAHAELQTALKSLEESGVKI